MIVRHKMLLAFIFALYAPHNYTMYKQNHKKHSTTNTNTGFSWSGYTPVLAKGATVCAFSWLAYKGFCEGNNTKLGAGITGTAFSAISLLKPDLLPHAMYKIGEQAPRSPALLSIPFFWLAYRNRDNYAATGTLGTLGIAAIASSVLVSSEDSNKISNESLFMQVDTKKDKQEQITFPTHMNTSRNCYASTLNKVNLSLIDTTIRCRWNNNSSQDIKTHQARLNGIGGIIWIAFNNTIKSIHQHKIAYQKNTRIAQWPLIWRLLHKIGLCTYSPQYAPSDIDDTTTLHTLALKYSNIINYIIPQNDPTNGNTNHNPNIKYKFTNKLPKKLHSSITADALKNLIQICKSGNTSFNINYTDIKKILFKYLDAVTLVEKYLNDTEKPILLIDDNKAVYFNYLALQKQSLKDEEISKIIDAILLLRLKFNDRTLLQYREEQSKKNEKDDSAEEEESDDDESEEEEGKEDKNDSTQILFPTSTSSNNSTPTGNNPFSTLNLNSDNFNYLQPNFVPQQTGNNYNSNPLPWNPHNNINNNNNISNACNIPSNDKTTDMYKGFKRQRLNNQSPICPNNNNDDYGFVEVQLPDQEIVTFLNSCILNRRFTLNSSDTQWLEFGVQAENHTSNQYYRFRFNPRNEIFTYQLFNSNTWKDAGHSFSQELHNLKNKSKKFFKKVFIFDTNGDIPQEDQKDLWCNLQKT